MRSRLLNLFACALLGGGGLSCRQAQAPKPVRVAALPPSAVAVVAGEKISEAALRSELQRRFRNAPEGGLTTEQKLESLERLIQNEAVYAQAKASGFEQSAELQARIKNFVIAQFREQRLTNAPLPITERELEAAYQAQGERFAQPAAVRGAAIFLQVPRTATAEKKAEMRQRAEAVLSEARAAVDERAYAQVVAKHSEDGASRYRGGDFGWMTREGASEEPALVEALMALSQPGEFAPLVETPLGFYVAKLMEKREPGRKPLGEVKEAVHYRLSQQKAEQAERDFYASMKSGLDIQINRALLDSISLPTENHQPPRTPGSATAQLRQISKP